MLDSFTDMQVLLKQEILATAKKSHDNLTLEEWGVLADRTQAFAKSFRDLDGINRLVICLLALIDDDKGAVDSDGQKLRAPMMSVDCPARIPSSSGVAASNWPAVPVP